MEGPTDRHGHVVICVSCPGGGGGGVGPVAFLEQMHLTL